MDHHGIHQTIDLLGFLMLGLLGGFGHCAAMCSPFVLFVSRRFGAAGSPSAPRHPSRVVPSSPAGSGGAATEVVSRPHAAAFAAQGWYTAGRITTYAALGALAGALGGAVELAGRLVGVRRAALMVAGGVLVVWALASLLDFAWRSASLPARAQSFLGSVLRGRVPGHPFLVGLFLGLLPCGFLYSAVVAAVARGGALQGAAALAIFGLGTAPALLGVSLADELLARNRALLNRLAQLFILAMGASFLWRGLAL